MADGEADSDDARTLRPRRTPVAGPAIPLHHPPGARQRVRHREQQTFDRPSTATATLSMRYVCNTLED